MAAPGAPAAAGFYTDAIDLLKLVLGGDLPGSKGIIFL